MLECLFINILVGVRDFQTALDEICKVKIPGIAFSELQVDGLHCILHPLPECNRVWSELFLCCSPWQVVLDQGIKVQSRLFKQFFHCHSVKAALRPVKPNPLRVFQIRLDVYDATNCRIHKPPDSLPFAGDRNKPADKKTSNDGDEDSRRLAEGGQQSARVPVLFRRPDNHAKWIALHH
ncbi:hypothetical protein NtRootA1_29570 [Arthrobacter sp. NtRootA1]|nr:hypothetical protein NtRootA1_29570 [Arthrobacter sp. NtRootA1]